MATVKLIQISAVNNGEYSILYALDEAGRVWINNSPTVNSKGMWELLEQPSDDTKVEYAPPRFG